MNRFECIVAGSILAFETTQETPRARIIKTNCAAWQHKTLGKLKRYLSDKGLTLKKV